MQKGDMNTKTRLSQVYMGQFLQTIELNSVTRSSEVGIDPVSDVVPGQSDTGTRSHLENEFL